MQEAWINVTQDGIRHLYDRMRATLWAYVNVQVEYIEF